MIEYTNRWYTNTETDFHEAMSINGDVYDLERTNFAKRICADDANLIEVVEVNACPNTETNNIINEILKDNRFEVMYRKQIEQMSANGTVGCYIRVDDADYYDGGETRGGQIKLNYCSSLNIAPLTVINDEIVECAFSGYCTVDSKERVAVVIFTKENGTYTCKSVILNDSGKEIPELTQITVLGDVKPFAIMRTAEVNNLDMIGYGYPKLLTAIPNLEILDLSMTIWRRDLEKSDKILLVNDSLCEKDEKGNIIPMSKEKKKIFVQVGKDKLPDQDTLIQEYNPTIRIAEISESIEKALSMLSMSFGFGTRKYTFESGQIMTATEYAGERQDAMQEINKQRGESINYITEICEAIRWFYNALYGANLQELDVKVDFDDSYIEDRAAIAESMRNDALSFNIPKLRTWYFMKKYNLTEEEAAELVEEMPDEGDGSEDEE